MSASGKLRINGDSQRLRVQDHQEKSHKALIYDPLKEIRRKTHPKMTNKIHPKIAPKMAQKSQGAKKEK
jgi:hypothetical protein